MAEAREFKPLKELGDIPLGDQSVLKFYVDEFKGHKYGSIRTFVTGETYSGPTKSGVTMNGRILAEAIPLLEKLPPQPAGSEDSELGRWSKKGVRIPYKDLPTALEYLRQMKALVAAP